MGGETSMLLQRVGGEGANRTDASSIPSLDLKWGLCKTKGGGTAAPPLSGHA